MPRLGPLLRHHPMFAPAGVNANFVQVLGEGELALRTFETGVEGETLACGTGSAAAAIMAARRFGWDPAYRTGQKPVLIHARSGDVLRVYFEVIGDAVRDLCLETVVRFLYRGVLHADLAAAAPGDRRARGAMIFSIDQNCHSLWDALPKCQALAAAGHRVRHFVEDIDVAFTALGATAARAAALHLARERYHHSGGADWGAAMFYSGFLGRLPVDVRGWEPYTGMKTAALARQLDRTVEDLYEEFSPGDNWQLIGPSYVGDRRHHRMIADLTVAETARFLRQLVDRAQADMLARFPDAGPPTDASRRWFAAETARLEKLLADHAGGKLVDLYRAWMGQLLGESVASWTWPRRWRRCRPTSPAVALLETFCANYGRGRGTLQRGPAAARPSG